MTNLDWMRLGAETAFSVDKRGRIVSQNEPGEDDPPPRFCLGRTKDGSLRWYRHDLPEPLVEELERLAASEPLLSDFTYPPIHRDEYCSLLGRHGESQNIYYGPAYRFPEEIDPTFRESETPFEVVRIGSGDRHLLRTIWPYFPYSEEAPEGEESVERGPCVAVVIEGQAVSVCFCSRLASRAAHAGLDTLEGYRRRGYASRAVAGWASAVREEGREPFYGTTWDNLASQGVARRLGLILFGSNFSIT